MIIYYAIRCLVNPGDEVIVPDPGFPTYYSAIKFCGAVPKRVPLFEKNGFRMNPDDVEALITDKTRLIIMNSPHNPTGSVMTPEEVKGMAQIAQKYDIYLYSDEIYVRMILDKFTVFSTPGVFDGCRDRVIIANGFSKGFAMTGWRLGVAIGPTDVIEKMGLLLQTTSSCVSPFIQRAGIEAIIGDQTEVKNMMTAYKKRRDLLIDGLNSIDGIHCLIPGGAFYVFPNISGTGMSSCQFADLMLERGGVALLPGTNFGEYGEGYVRLCYATASDRIVEGIERIRKTLKEGQRE
jgi:aspartate/methionine/tyrosine aminotransferase